MKWNDMIWCDVKGNDMTWWFYDMNIRCTMLYDRLYDTSCTAYRNRMYIRYYDIRCLMYDVCYMMYLMWYDPTLEHMYLYILAYASSMQMRVWDTTILGPNLSNEKTGHHRVSSTDCPPPISFSPSMNFPNERFVVATSPKPHDFSNAKRHVCVMASACGASYAFTSSHGKALGSKTWWHLWVQSPIEPERSWTFDDFCAFDGDICIFRGVQASATSWQRRGPAARRRAGMAEEVANRELLLQ